jgi:hypothetical protein
VRAVGRPSPARGGEWLAEPSATSGVGGGRNANSGAGLARTSADPPQHPPPPVSRGAACDAASRMWPRRCPTDAVPDPSHAASRPLTPPRTGASVVPQWLIYLAGDARRVGVRGGFGTAAPMVSATFRDSCRARGPSAGGRLVTASFMPTVLEIFVIRRAGGRPGVVPGESTAAGLVRPTCPGKARGPPDGYRGGTPGSAVHLTPGKRGQRGPSVKQPTVCTDRHNCAHRPS